MVGVQGLPLVLRICVFIVVCMDTSSAYPIMDSCASCLSLLLGGYLFLTVIWAVMHQGGVVFLIVAVSGVDPAVARPFGRTLEVGVFTISGHGDRGSR